MDRNTLGQYPSREERRERDVEIVAGTVALAGTLTVPAGAQGIVVFAHGSGSSRLSPRNRYVAAELQRSGLATLLLDLLKREEEAIDARTHQYRFHIRLLATRLTAAAEWIRTTESTRDLAIGYFGASTGAAAALVSAAGLPGTIGAIVSRGGRPDLAGDALPRVTAPTLLIVGSNDPVVLGLNQLALQGLQTTDKQLAVVPGATHLFEEPGTLEQVARLAAEWFRGYLSHAATSLAA